ncbi:putative centriolin-like [Apostichopus japonicus]|uniref:Putative centriolin-like n=1 Tax=Stichopus japonicus TaxID=307972 RepID=A0A2G8LA90_STIJA|nr:putative centriolin-like [Apostichopus japonicus]
MKKTLAKKNVKESSSDRKLPNIPASKLASPPKAVSASKEESPRNLVRYISEDAIKSRTKKDDLKNVLLLDLALREGEKKIKYIEKLEDVTRLQVLRLGFNQIQKIENVDHLVKLRELDLSCNCIDKIEGLETLVHLQVLNISSNLIETIPAWLGKKLKALREINLAANLIFSLHDIYKLRGLKDLIAFSIAGNPLCDLAHYKLFIVFHLRYLTHLDGEPISAALRQEAQARFAQDEIENFEMQLEKEEKRLHDLEGDHNKSLADFEKSQKKIKKLEAKTSRYEEQVEGLQHELEAKNELLKRKMAELNKTCQKQFRLEQELAFHKIDAKFEPLGQLMEVDEIEGGTEESSYIGQAGYRRNPLMDPHHTPRSKTLGYHRSSDISPEMQRNLHGNLDAELAEKENQIEKGKRLS